LGNVSSNFRNMEKLTSFLFGGANLSFYGAKLDQLAFLESQRQLGDSGNRKGINYFTSKT